MILHLTALRHCAFSQQTGLATPEGLEQARAMGGKLNHLPLGAVVITEHIRTAQTACSFMEGMGGVVGRYAQVNVLPGTLDDTFQAFRQLAGFLRGLTLPSEMNHVLMICHQPFLTMLVLNIDGGFHWRRPGELQGAHITFDTETGVFTMIEKIM